MKLNFDPGRPSMAVEIKVGKEGEVYINQESDTIIIESIVDAKLLAKTLLLLITSNQGDIDD